MQSMVVTTGATFAVQAVEIGANQVAVPIGDSTFVTCGPFECVMGMDAPEISIANSPKCNAWDPTLELHMGLVDNDVLESGENTDDTDNDGIDLGWVTSSSLAMNVKHVFSGVSGATNTDATSKAKKGDDESLAMSGIQLEGIQGDREGDETAMPPVIAVMACTPEDIEGEGMSDQGSRDYPDRMRSGIFKPENCFRLVGAGAGGKAATGKKGPDFLAGYSLEMSPTGADVDWGSKVEWDEDPFEDLTCDSMTAAAADYLDVCELFNTEVASAVEGDWVANVLWGGTVAAGNESRSQAVMWTAGKKTAATAERFSTLWFDDDLDGKVKNKNADRPAGATSELHDLYDNNASGTANTDEARANLEVIWQLLTNTDGSPNRGDFGKVDLVSDEDDDDTDEVNETTAAGNPDGNADNYDGDMRAFRTIRKCTDDDGGDGCDAKWSETFEIGFADGTFGCSASHSVTITCEWDAQGEMGVGRGTAAADQFTPATDGNAGTAARFYECTAK